MRSFYGIRLLLMTGMMISLSACSTLPKRSSEPAQPHWLTDSGIFTERLAATSTLNSWHYSAKVGVSTPQGKEQANLIWQFADQANNIRLFGPLGAGAVRIEFDQYGVVLSDNKGVLHRGKSAEALLTSIVGWPIPIDALSYWLFVLPNPGAPYRYQVDDNGAVSKLEQMGWSIQYSAYKPYANNQFLPRKVTATKHVAPNHTVVVKLVTKAWQW